jgi:glycosyltransferase involved in cell wall biosynthesis
MTQSLILTVGACFGVERSVDQTNHAIFGCLLARKWTVSGDLLRFAAPSRFQGPREFVDVKAAVYLAILCTRLLIRMCRSFMMQSNESNYCPRVSVALTTYNGELHLKEQLDSLARQTVRPFEVVVTDDGSADNTLTILREFAEQVRFPVKVVSNEIRLGFADNFLKAASLCTGDLIAFCDQDDVWIEQKLELCAQYFKDPDVVICVHSAAVWDGTQANGAHFPDFKYTTVHKAGSLNPFMLIPGFAMVFRPELLALADNTRRLRHVLNLGPPRVPMHHDSWVWILGSSVGRVAVVADSLALYRQHQTNTLGVPRRLSAKEAFVLALSDYEYSGLAALEREASDFFSSLKISIPQEFRAAAASSADGFAMLADYHTLRSIIYNSSRGLLGRLAIYQKLFFLGAYRNDLPFRRLGSKAALKDLILGAFNAHKVLVSLFHKRPAIMAAFYRVLYGAR